MTNFQQQFQVDKIRGGVGKATLSAKKARNNKGENDRKSCKIELLQTCNCYTKHKNEIFS